MVGPLRLFWNWLGKVDDVRGRLGVLKWPTVIVAAVFWFAGGFLVGRFGIVGLAFLIAGTLLFVVGLLGFRADRRAEKRRTGMRQAMVDVLGRSDEKTKIALELKHELGRVLELATVKQSTIEKGVAAQHERGFRFPDEQWKKYREHLAEWPAFYGPASRAYSEVDRVNANIIWLEGLRDQDTKLGLGPDHDLPKLIQEVTVAVRASAAVIDGKPPAGVTATEKQLGVTGLSDAEIEGLERRFWKQVEDDETREVEDVLGRGLDLRAFLDNITTSPWMTTHKQGFSLTDAPHRAQAWLKEAQILIYRRSPSAVDFSLVRRWGTAQKALTAVDATLEALTKLGPEQGKSG